MVAYWHQSIFGLLQTKLHTLLSIVAPKYYSSTQSSMKRLQV